MSERITKKDLEWVDSRPLTTEDWKKLDEAELRAILCNYPGIQAQIAKELGVSQATVSLVWHGKATSGPHPGRDSQGGEIMKDSPDYLDCRECGEPTGRAGRDRRQPVHWQRRPVLHEMLRSEN